LAALLFSEDVELLAERQVLHHKVGFGREDGPENRGDGPKSEH